MTYLTHGMILRIACAVMILCNSVGSYAQMPTFLHIAPVEKTDTSLQVSVKPSIVSTDSGTVFVRTFAQEAKLVVMNAALLSANESFKIRLSNKRRSWWDDVKWFAAGACVGMLAWEAAR